MNFFCEQSKIVPLESLISKIQLIICRKIASSSDGNRDETINYITSEYSKKAQKESMRNHDWVGNVIRKELCKRLKLDHINIEYA